MDHEQPVPHARVAAVSPHANSALGSLALQLWIYVALSYLLIWTIRATTLPVAGPHPIASALILLGAGLLIHWQGSARAQRPVFALLLNLLVLGLLLLSSARVGLFSIWSWPLAGAGFGAGLALVQVTRAQHARTLALGGGLVLALVLAVSAALGARRAGGLDAVQLQQLLRSLVGALSAFGIVQMWLYAALRGRPFDEARRRAVWLVVGAGLAVALFSQFAALLQGSVLSADSAIGQQMLLIVLVAGVMWATVLANLPTQRLTTGLALLVFALSLASIWRVGDAGAPSIVLVALIAAQVPRQRWVLVLVLWGVLLASLAASPLISLAAGLMHGLTASAVLAALMWLGAQLEAAQNQSVSPLQHAGLGDRRDAALHARSERLIRRSAWAAGLLVLVLGGAYSAWRLQNQHSQTLAQLQMPISRTSTALRDELRDLAKATRLLAERAQSSADRTQTIARWARPLTELVSPGATLAWAPRGVVQNLAGASAQTALRVGADLLQDDVNRAAYQTLVDQKRAGWVGVAPGQAQTLIYAAPVADAHGKQVEGLVIGLLDFQASDALAEARGDALGWNLLIGRGGRGAALDWSTPAWRTAQPATSSARWVWREAGSGSGSGASSSYGGWHQLQSQQPLDDNDWWLQVRAQTSAASSDAALPMAQAVVVLALLIGYLTAEIMRQRLRQVAGRQRDEELARLQAVMGGSDIGQLLCTAQGQMLWLNQTAEAVFKMPAESIRAVNPLSHPRWVQLGWSQAVAQVLADGHKQTWQYAGEGAFGQALDLQMSVSRHVVDGQTLLLFQVLDLTVLHAQQRELQRQTAEAERARAQADIERERVEVARARTEQALRQAEEAFAQAQAASQAKSQFLATISHEIRTPLNWMMGMLQVLLHRDDLSKSASEQVNTAYQGAQVLLAVLNDVLDYSGLAYGKKGLRAEPMRVFDSVMYIKSLTKTLPLRDKVSLEFSTDTPNLLTQVIGDDLRLRQILLNLVSNAVKFTDEGTVKLSARVAARSESALTFEIVVEDTGIGMSLETQARLFTPFMQADMSDTRRHGGTGLGLAISKGLLDAMGARVEVSSALGSGTRFAITLTLPLAKASSVPRPTREDRSDDRGQRVADLARMAQIRHMAGLQAKAEASAQTSVPASAASDQPSELAPDAASAQPAPAQSDARGPAGVAPRDAATAQTSVPAPVQAITSPASASQQEFVGQLHGVRVLVVDDDPTNLRVGQYMMNAMGAITSACPDAQSAIEALRQAGGSIDLVLMDLQMADLDGLEATRRIRSDPNPGVRDVLVLAMTGRLMSNERELAKQAGMNGFLSKPLIWMPLVNEILRVLAERDARASAAGKA